MFISQKLFDEYKERFPFPSKGDLLISVIGSIGRVVEYKGKDEYFQDSNVVWLQHNGAIVNSFLKQFYSIVEWSGIEGSTIKHLYNKDILETEITLPCQQEQTQIGAFFKELDQMIELHQRKHNKLVTLKQAMLQKMFPQGDSRVPEIRFKGFSGDWEKFKLGDIANFINGRAYSQNELLDRGKYKVLRVGNFYTNSSWYFSDLQLGEKYYANKGDLLYTWSASFGPHIWEGDKVIYHYHIWKVELSEQLRKEFALQLLENDKKRILSTSSGSTMIHITKEGMELKEFTIPQPEEQQKIGTYFCKLDDLITKHATQLQKLKQIKSACLEKMFV